ncbi:MAG: hypothetical protein Q8N84_00900 [bacterium]|nr:hypothetical protein [bacterium]
MNPLRPRPITKLAALTNNFRLFELIPSFSFVFFIFYILYFIFPVSAQEQPQSALGVSPAIFELVLEPGEEKTETLRVFNVTNFPLPIKASVKNFTPKEDIPEEAKKIFDASAWFTIEPTDFILQPKENKIITLTISPPKEAEPGGHYATIYFQPLLPVEVLSPQTAYLTARIGVLSFLVVKGEIQEKASLASWQTESFRQFGPVNFNLQLKNEGNVHLLPAGEVTIWNWQNKEVAKIPLSPSQILPQTTKNFASSWPKKYPLGKFLAQAKLSFGSEQQPIISEKISFWIVPWLPLSIGVLLLTVTLLLLIIMRRRLKLAWSVLLGREKNLKNEKSPAIPNRFKQDGKILNKFFHRKGVKRKA